jgi:hypothetical protein
VSGEGITDALDEDDVRKYASLFIPYNVAVIFLLVGIYALVYFKYSDKIVLPESVYLRYILNVAVISVLTKRWWGHRGLYWLFTVEQNEYEEYIKELEGSKKPEHDRIGGFLLYMKIREHLAKKGMRDDIQGRSD